MRRGDDGGLFDLTKMPLRYGEEVLGADVSVGRVSGIGPFELMEVADGAEGIVGKWARVLFDIFPELNRLGAARAAARSARTVPVVLLSLFVSGLIVGVVEFEGGSIGDNEVEMVEAADCVVFAVPELPVLDLAW